MKFTDGAMLKYSQELVPISTAGQEIELAIKCTQFGFTTSLNNSALLTSDTFNMLCNVTYPLVHNDLLRWKFLFELETTQGFPLFEHLPLFQDLCMFIYILLCSD